MAGALQTRGVDLLCSGFLAQLLPKAQQHPHLGAALFFLSMNDAVKSLEDQALQQVAATTTYRADVERKLNFASKRSTASPSEEDCVFFEDTCRRLLEPLGLADLSAPLRNYFNFQTAGTGDILWNPGDAADFAFLLVRGHVGVLDEHRSPKRHQAVPHNFVESSIPGQFSGELNLFTGEARKNKIVATEGLRMWTITRDSLLRMRQDDLQLAFALQGIALRYASHRMYLSMLDGHVHTV